jgi:hypothetical protein
MTALIAACFILGVALWIALAAIVSATRVLLRSLSHLLFGYRAHRPMAAERHARRVGVDYAPKSRKRSGVRNNWDGNRQ